MTLGAEAWFLICERLRAGRSSSLLFCDPPQAAAPTGFDLDVNMADTPISFLPSTGKKRPRDDEDVDIDVFEDEARFEKVGSRHLAEFVKPYMLIARLK